MVEIWHVYFVGVLHLLLRVSDFSYPLHIQKFRFCLVFLIFWVYGTHISLPNWAREVETWYIYLLEGSLYPSQSVFIKKHCRALLFLFNKWEIHVSRLLYENQAEKATYYEGFGWCFFVQLVKKILGSRAIYSLEISLPPSSCPDLISRFSGGFTGGFCFLSFFNNISLVFFLMIELVWAGEGGGRGF